MKNIFISIFDSDLGMMYLKKSGDGAAIARSNLGYVIRTFMSNKKQTNFDRVQEPQKFWYY